MPKTGFHMPTTEDTKEYINEYIQYKIGKMRELDKKMDKYNNHIKKAYSILQQKKET